MELLNIRCHYSASSLRWHTNFDHPSSSNGVSLAVVVFCVMLAYYRRAGVKAATLSKVSSPLQHHIIATDVYLDMAYPHAVAPRGAPLE